MPKVIKPSNPFTRMFVGFCFNKHFLRRHKFWLHDSFLPNSRNEEMMGDGFFVLLGCRFVLNSKRLLSTSCNTGHGSE